MRTAIYLRISSEDADLRTGEKDESESISNQRSLLREYVSSHADLSGSEILEFCDDGWSGTNFERPAVKELLEQVRRGQINCILVKDLSRFGRDYLTVGDYRKCSKTHYIRLDFLEQVVLYEVKRLACFASEYENDFIKAMIGRSAKVAENTALRKQRELDALTARDRELDMLFERLYEDNVAGKIDDARFAKMSKRYEQEQGENAKKIKALRLELKKDESKRMDIDDFLETVRRYTDATTITKRMVAELIDHIEVYHAEKQDGVTNQRVVIYYNCIGAFDVPDRRKIPEADIIMETRKGVALSYAPEQVAV